jgi:alkylated DNA repair dioxygenase AlkB
MFSEFENLEKIEVLREDGMVDYYPHFLDLDQSTALFQKISSSEKFEQNDILLFGKRVKVPRLEAYYALNGEAYGYSGQALTVQLFPSYLNELRLQVQEKTKSQFNALLINYYRDGQLQKHYKHQLPKIKGLQQARLNLTFRWVRPSV